MEIIVYMIELISASISSKSDLVQVRVEMINIKDKSYFSVKALSRITQL